MEPTLQCKLIIAGSRSIVDLEHVRLAYDDCPFEATEIVSGAARGVDQLGEQLAEIYGIPIKRFPADWSKGRWAGFERNAKMGLYADALLAVWDGKSNGTRNMIQYMKKQGKPTYVYELRQST